MLHQGAQVSEAHGRRSTRALDRWDSPFESVNHAMSLISTGGLNVGRFTWALDVASDSRLAVVIMILGSLPLTLYVATLPGHRLTLLKDHQVRGFFGFLIVTWLACFWGYWRYSLYWY